MEHVEPFQSETYFCLFIRFRPISRPIELCGIEQN